MKHNNNSTKRRNTVSSSKEVLKHTVKKTQSASAIEIGQRIQKARINSGYKTQEKLAEKMGCTYQTISKWERGESEPGYDKLNMLCDLFNCDSDYLIRPSVQKSRRKQLESVQTYTGLSEKAIENLHRHNEKDDGYLDIVSRLLEDESLIYSIGVKVYEEYGENIAYAVTEKGKNYSVHPDMIRRVDDLHITDAVMEFVEKIRNKRQGNVPHKP